MHSAVVALRYFTVQEGHGLVFHKEHLISACKKQSAKLLLVNQVIHVYFRTVRVWLKRDTGQYWPSICHSMPGKKVFLLRKTSLFLLFKLINITTFFVREMGPMLTSDNAHTWDNLQ